MKLYECKRNSVVRLLEDASGPFGSPKLKKGDEIKFINIDGMYSFCHSPKHFIPVHPEAWTEVEYVQSTG